MSDESVGYYWAQAAKESEAMRRHDNDHVGDPVNWCEECSICMERVEEARGPCETAAELAHQAHKEELAIDCAIDSDIDAQRHGV